MFDPELYERNNEVSRKDAIECLEKFAPEWADGCKVLDLGCGDGSLTARVLRRSMPGDFQLLVGADISPEMVAYANTKYGDDRTKFIQLDMTGDIPPEIDCFEYVFSSYAIHWAQEQEKTFSNIYNLLAEGGSCLLLFVGYIRIYDLYRALAKQPKWQHHFEGIEKYISPYQDMQEPDKQVYRIMANTGFKNIRVECERKTCIYEEDHFRNLMLAICPLKIPAHQMQVILDDYMQLAKELNIVDQVEDKTFVSIEYTLITARGVK